LAIEASDGLFLGSDNLANANTLDYVLEEIQSIRFGVDLFPGAIEKASAIGFKIITGHVFHDGNKRVGLLACYNFLDINGYEMSLEPHEEILRFTLSVAKGEVEIDEYTEWVRQRTTKRENNANG